MWLAGIILWLIAGYFASQWAVNKTGVPMSYFEAFGCIVGWPILILVMFGIGKHAIKPRRK